MPMERRGRVIRVIPTLVNRQREEPTGCDGERQLSTDGTSRVSREAQARICERLGVQFPGATRPPLRTGPTQIGKRCAADHYLSPPSRSPKADRSFDNFGGKLR